MAFPGTSPRLTEALDDPGADAALTRATLTDIAFANTWLGGRAAVAYGVRELLEGEPSRSRVLLADVGAGMGDVAEYLERYWHGRGVALRAVALDWHREAVRLCRERGLQAVLGAAPAIPLADASVDIVVASQLLHHFAHDAAVDLLREFKRVTRLGVVIADLERARLAAAGLWCAALAFGFHPVSRHDGVVSVRRGYAPDELRRLLKRAGVAAVVRRRWGFRLVATWRSDRADG
jgi:ubiquinone/menaquinone biosynthesis C-methylase UbiE